MCYLSSPMAQKEIIVTCPHCKKKFNYYESDFRPFCSERCRLVDLGLWLDEGYRIPVAPEEIEDEEKSEGTSHEDKE